MSHSDYRKHNDKSQNSSTYHKKGGTEVRAIFKEDLKKKVEDEYVHPSRTS